MEELHNFSYHEDNEQMENLSRPGELCLSDILENDAPQPPGRLNCALEAQPAVGQIGKLFAHKRANSGALHENIVDDLTNLNPERQANAARRLEEYIRKTELQLNPQDFARYVRRQIELINRELDQRGSRLRLQVPMVEPGNVRVQITQGDIVRPLVVIKPKAM